MTAPCQHYPTTPQEEIRAHLRKAIRELEALADSVPVASYATVQHQRDSAHNYLTNMVPRIAETAFDCTLNIAAIAASIGNDESFDVKGVRAALDDVLGDELFDARQWADERETEDA